VVRTQGWGNSTGLPGSVFQPADQGRGRKGEVKCAICDYRDTQSQFHSLCGHCQELVEARMQTPVRAAIAERDARWQAATGMTLEEAEAAEAAKVENKQTDAHPYGSGQRPMGWDPQAHE
jgi:hypothetical protein